MFAPNYHVSYLPSIHTTTESARLLYGSLVRLCLHSGLYYGCYRLLLGYLRKQASAAARAERDSLCYLLSMGVEVGVSMLLVPCRYLAATTAPRFLLDFMLTSWSDKLSCLDAFRPGHFASYATYAFGSGESTTTAAAAADARTAAPAATAAAPLPDWNFDFFVWQVPSVLLSLGKLYARRRRVGAACTRTRRVLLALGAQVLLRAYMATFSTMLPDDDAEAVNAVLVTVLEGMATSYVVRHTWPFAFGDGGSSSSSNSGSSNGSHSTTTTASTTTSSGTLEDGERVTSTDASSSTSSSNSSNPDSHVGNGAASSQPAATEAAATTTAAEGAATSETTTTTAVEEATTTTTTHAADATSA